MVQAGHTGTGLLPEAVGEAGHRAQDQDGTDRQARISGEVHRQGEEAISTEGGLRQARDASTGEGGRQAGAHRAILTIDVATFLRGGVRLREIGIRGAGRRRVSARGAEAAPLRG